MTTTLTAIFDGKTLVPEQPVDLKVKCRYRVRIEEEIVQKPNQDPLDVIESLIGTCPGPEDLALNHDHYLHGLPKRELKQ